MAFTTAHSASNSTGPLRRIADRVVETLTWLINIRPMIEDAERLTRMTDAELAAKGTSRSDEITRIFGPRARY